MENIFLEKKMFLNFLSQKVTNFCSKKKKLKKNIFFTKTNLEKTFFIKKNCKIFFWKLVVKIVPFLTNLRSHVLKIFENNRDEKNKGLCDLMHNVSWAFLN